jgi:hypothetical protein
MDFNAEKLPALTFEELLELAHNVVGEAMDDIMSVGEGEHTFKTVATKIINNGATLHARLTMIGQYISPMMNADWSLHSRYAAAQKKPKPHLTKVKG